MPHVSALPPARGDRPIAKPILAPPASCHPENHKRYFTQPRREKRLSVQYWLRRYKSRHKLWHWLLRHQVVAIDHPISLYSGEGGGWHLPGGLIQSDWLVYDFGVGEDISLDIALIDRHGCAIHAFDPTPKAIAYMKTRALPGFHFHPVGVWNENAIIKFWAPRHAHYESYSALNLHGTTEYVKCQVKTLKTLAAELGHDHINMIKMDIEGAEQRVIPDLVAEGFRPELLCIEFDQADDVFSLLSIRIFLNALRLHRTILNSGYRLIHKIGANVIYLHNSLS